MNRVKNLASWKVAFYTISLMWILLAFSSLHSGSATWDEYLDFEGALGSLWHGVNVIKGHDPNIDTITFNLEWFGNATRWITFLPWLSIQPFDFNQIQVLPRPQLALITGYYISNHINSILFGAGTAWLLFLFLSQYASKKIAVIGSVMLLLFPLWAGHSWMNSKDVPFAFSYTLYSYYLAQCTSQGACASPRKLQFLRYAIYSIAVMLMVGSRLPSIAFIMCTEVIMTCVHNYRKPFEPRSLSSLIVQSDRRRLASLVVGILLGLALTPQSWGMPFKYIINCIKYFSEASYYAGEKRGLIQGLGEIIATIYDSTPFLHLFGLAVLSLALIGACLTRKSFDKKQFFCDLNPLPLPFALQILVPLLLIILKRDAQFSMRHILFVIPVLCAYSSIGVGKICLDSSRRLKTLTRCIALLSLLTLSIEFLGLHPYQYVYKSELSRIAQASLRAPLYLNDYWGYSAKESLQAVVKKNSNRGKSADSIIAIKPPTSFNPVLFDAYTSMLNKEWNSVIDGEVLVSDYAHEEISLTGKNLKSANHCVKRLVLFPVIHKANISCTEVFRVDS